MCKILKIRMYNNRAPAGQNREKKRIVFIIHYYKIKTYMNFFRQKLDVSKIVVSKKCFLLSLLQFILPNHCNNLYFLSLAKKNICFNLLYFLEKFTALYLY